MRILLDTNILCRTAQANHSLHAISQTSITRLRERDELCAWFHKFFTNIGRSRRGQYQRMALASIRVPN